MGDAWSNTDRFRGCFVVFMLGWVSGLATATGHVAIAVLIAAVASTGMIAIALSASGVPELPPKAPHPHDGGAS